MPAERASPKETLWRLPPRTSRGERAVLIADDDIPSSRALGLAFEERGFLVHAAHTGLDAVRQARRTSPGAVLIDLMMPLGDGWEVADEIRRSGSNSMLIAYTGIATEQEWEQCRRAGFDAFFQKPCSVDNLIALLERYFDQAPEAGPEDVQHAGALPTG